MPALKDARIFDARPSKIACKLFLRRDRTSEHNRNTLRFRGSHSTGCPLLMTSTAALTDSATLPTNSASNSACIALTEMEHNRIPRALYFLLNFHETFIEASVALAEAFLKQRLEALLKSVLHLLRVSQFREINRSRAPRLARRSES